MVSDKNNRRWLIKPTLSVLSIMILSFNLSFLIGASDVKSLIQKVETGLNPSVRIAGLTQWNLKERMAFYGVPGISVAVIENFKIHWAKGYGVANKDTGEPVTIATLFQAASISKPVAAAVALKLVQKGVLKLDEDVNLKLKSWQIPESEFNRREKVTLRRLLSHSAGLTVHGFRGYGKGEKVPDIIDVLEGKPPANSKPVRVDKKPGSGFRYSGGGYTVLQLLMTDVTGRPFANLLQDYILDPVGMKHSSFKKPLPPSLAILRASPHSRTGKPLPAHWFLKGGSGCCGLWTTATDLARFAIEIQRVIRGDEDRILTPQMGRAMVTPTNSENMGLGFAISHRGQGSYFQHSGGNPPGFICLLLASKDKGYGAAVMTNSPMGGQLCREFMQAVADAYNWEGSKSDRFTSISQMIQTYRKLKKENPKDSRITENRLNTLGYTFLQSANLGLALEIFKLNCDLYPRSANCYDSLGDLYLATRDHKKALTSFRKALEILDKYPEVQGNQQQLRKTTGKKIKELERKKINPSSEISGG